MKDVFGFLMSGDILLVCQNCCTSVIPHLLFDKIVIVLMELSVRTVCIVT